MTWLQTWNGLSSWSHGADVAVVLVAAVLFVALVVTWERADD